MELYVVPQPVTSFDEQACDPDVNPVMLAYFRIKALEAIGWDENTVLFMTVEKDGVWIREHELDPEPGELRYVGLDEV
jgi:hypothetical protein